MNARMIRVLFLLRGLEVTLANGSVWYIDPQEAAESVFWQPATRVLIVTGASRDYLVNTRTGDAVAAR